MNWQNSAFPSVDGANFVEVTGNSTHGKVSLQGYDQYGTPKWTSLDGRRVCFIGTDIEGVHFRRLMTSSTVALFSIRTRARNIIVMNEERLKAGEVALITRNIEVFYVDREGPMPPELIRLLGTDDMTEVLALPEAE